jgi:hypothetical protein
MTQKAKLDLAINTLAAICRSKKSPSNAKASAARTLLEMLGAIGRLQQSRLDGERSLVDMDASELDSELSRLKAIVESTVDAPSTTQAKAKRNTTRAKNTPRAKRAKRAKRSPSTASVDTVDGVAAASPGAMRDAPGDASDYL